MKNHPENNNNAEPTNDDYIKGRGAQLNTPNRFHQHQQVTDHWEGIDECTDNNNSTQFIMMRAASLVNKVESPDVHMLYSMNPYAGCEHGCIYCYARNAHEYLGYSAGLDFEQKIVVKENAAELLRAFLNKKGWDGTPITLSGNTDCYQPCERKFRITRSLLEVCVAYNQPVSIITKNGGLLADLDLLEKLGSRQQVSVAVTITSLDEQLRRRMEPRTTTAAQRFRIIHELSKRNIPVGVMMGPVIPGLNDHEMPALLKRAADNGAHFAGYTFVRLNGAVQIMFRDWLFKNFPDRAEKVWNAIAQSHGGKVNDSRFGKRMRGEGNVADMINQQFKKFCARYNLNNRTHSLNSSDFCVPGAQMRLFN